MLLVRKLFSRVNTFGLSRTYKGVPSSIPDLPNSESFILSYVHPVPSREPKTIEEIINPYPTLTSFLSDCHFWTSGPTKSRRDRDATQELLIREDFKPSDLKGVNFNVLEQEVRGYSSIGQWEQMRGWRKSNLAIGFPLSVKKMTEVRRTEAAWAARLRRGAPNPPPSTAAPVNGYPLSIPRFYYRSISSGKCGKPFIRYDLTICL
ncbi:hypothetical protein BDM02DRAFT_3273565 [Thelephora ganbajun]|uniref:Uncharacterized protein n=1 Tax=Thelephora ganbajun TaxID=370292 RepID=A0ACB6YXK0_THEGA|nr:hypothetical protein BDM02DRAFT_3273565 [Thelephora ganbajun]